MMRLDLASLTNVDQAKSIAALKDAVKNALTPGGILRIASCGHLPEMKEGDIKWGQDAINLADALNVKGSSVFNRNSRKKQSSTR
jgi:hypothetical protein